VPPSFLENGAERSNNPLHHIRRTAGSSKPIGKGVHGRNGKFCEFFAPIWDIDSAIKQLPSSINRALAEAIIDAGRDGGTGCTANDPDRAFAGIFRLLEVLRPQSTGGVRASIDRIFDNPDETLEDLATLPF
jgi:hypothetical protein